MWVPHESQHMPDLLALTLRGWQCNAHGRILHCIADTKADTGQRSAETLTEWILGTGSVARDRTCMGGVPVAVLRVLPI